MDTAYQGFESNVLTFYAPDVQIGDLVKVSGEGTVAKCAAKEPFVGMAVTKRGDFAGVQMRGYMEIKASGDFAYGFAKMDTDGSNGVTANSESGAMTHLVISKGTDTVGIIL